MCVQLLEFADYDEKLNLARERSRENDSVITGAGMIAGCSCVVAALEPMIMMGSMGLVAGEKIARVFRLPAKKSAGYNLFSPWRR